MSKYIFIDLDDTLLKTDIEYMKKIPSIKHFFETINQNHIEQRPYYSVTKSFPLIFKTILHIIYITFHLIKENYYENQVFYDHFDDELKDLILKNQNVYFISNAPVISKKQRLKSILLNLKISDTLVEKKLEKRLFVIGYLKKKGNFIKKFALKRKINIDNCLLIDDNYEQIKIAKKNGIQTILVDKYYNKNYDIYKKNHDDLCLFLKNILIGEIS